MDPCRLRTFVLVSMFVLVLMTNAPLTETEFLAASAKAHAERLNVHPSVHASTCSCGRRPKWCSRCDRDVESWSLTFFDGAFFCGSCLEDTGIDQIIAESDDSAIAAQ